MDEPFVYWHACFADSPLTRVILKPVLDGNGNLIYRLDLKRMHIHAPTLQEWERDFLPKAREALNQKARYDDYYAEPKLWGPMLDLIYGGQADWAWNL